MTTAAEKRRSVLPASIAVALSCALLVPSGTLANSPGGTASPAEKKGNTPSGGAAQPRAGTGAHVTSVRIVHATCQPATRCDGNPHHVSAGGTLAVVGVGLKAGMVIAFPRTARWTDVVPGKGRFESFTRPKDA